MASKAKFRRFQLFFFVCLQLGFVRPSILWIHKEDIVSYLLNNLNANK